MDEKEIQKSWNENPPKASTEEYEDDVSHEVVGKGFGHRGK